MLRALLNTVLLVGLFAASAPAEEASGPLCPAPITLDAQPLAVDAPTQAQYTLPAPADSYLPAPLPTAPSDAAAAPLAPYAMPGTPSDLAPQPESIASEPLFLPEYDAGPPLLPFLRDTRFGFRPTTGTRQTPTEGYDHYELPSRHYGLWFRPAAHEEANCRHCQPRAYAPRGFGWANRRTGFEIDYHPYVVKQLPPVHGPSYYHRQPLPACPCWLQGCQPAVDGQH